MIIFFRGGCCKCYNDDETIEMRLLNEKWKEKSEFLYCSFVYL